MAGSVGYLFAVKGYLYLSTSVVKAQTDLQVGHMDVAYVAIVAEQKSDVAASHYSCTLRFIKVFFTTSWPSYDVSARFLLLTENFSSLLKRTLLSRNNTGRKSI
jgi:hypothetical protein